VAIINVANSVHGKYFIDFNLLVMKFKQSELLVRVLS
jgi:hypothetical protein